MRSQADPYWSSRAGQSDLHRSRRPFEGTCVGSWRTRWLASGITVRQISQAGAGRPPDAVVCAITAMQFYFRPDGRAEQGPNGAGAAKRPDLDGGAMLARIEQGLLEESVSRGWLNGAVTPAGG